MRRWGGEKGGREAVWFEVPQDGHSKNTGRSRVWKVCQCGLDFRRQSRGWESRCGGVLECTEGRETEWRLGTLVPDG